MECEKSSVANGFALYDSGASVEASLPARALSFSLDNESVSPPSLLPYESDSIRLDHSISTRWQPAKRSFASVAQSLDGSIESWDRTAEEFFGYPAQEAIGQNILVLYPYQRRDEARMLADRVRRGETITRFCTVRMHRDGSLIPVSVSMVPIKNQSGIICGFSENFVDIRAQLQKKRLVWQPEFIDQSTGLLNHNGFRAYFDWCLEQGRPSARQSALVYLKIRNLHSYREVYGDSFIERLLVLISVSLKLSLPARSVISRYGTCEFVVGLSDIASVADSSYWLERVVGELATNISLDGIQLYVQAEVGIVMFPDGDYDYPALLSYAKHAICSNVEDE